MKKMNLLGIVPVLFIVLLLAGMFYEDDKNKKHLRQLDPAVRGRFRAFLHEVRGMGFTPEIISSGRTYAQQAYFKRQDARNASPGHSTHELGHGIDLRLHKGGKTFSKSTPKTEWLLTGVPTLAKNKYKMRWGGDFTGYPDNNHFDYLNV